MEFLVQLTAAPTFFSDYRDGVVYEVIYPTYARQMSFEAANDVARRLRQMGHEASTVVDIYGQPPTATDLAQAKRSVEFQVVFAGRYFAGKNASNEDLGSGDRTKAVSMSQAAAVEVMRRLKRMGFLDATVVEGSSPVVNVSEELKKIWPETAAKK